MPKKDIWSIVSGGKRREQARGVCGLALTITELFTRLARLQLTPSPPLHEAFPNSLDLTISHFMFVYEVYVDDTFLVLQTAVKP